MYNTDDLTTTHVYLRAVEGFGCDSWLMQLLRWPTNCLQHPPSAHLPSLFPESRKGQRIPAVTCDKQLQLWNSAGMSWCFWLWSHRFAFDSKIHINKLEFHETKLLFLLSLWPSGLVVGVAGAAIKLFYFGQKRQKKRISCRKQCSMCVFTFHMSDLWQRALFAAIWDDLMRVQKDFKARKGSHRRPVLLFFSLLLFINPEIWLSATPCRPFRFTGCLKTQTSIDGRRTLLKQTKTRNTSVKYVECILAALFSESFYFSYFNYFCFCSTLLFGHCFRLTWE